MVKVRLYDAVGNKGEQIGLALRPGDVSTRLWRALQDPDAIRKGGLHIRDMDRLASGEIPMSKIASLYTPGEIRQAIQRRMEEINRETSELAALSELLHDSGWTDALGGPAASTTRESKMTREWHSLSSPRKSLSSDGGDIRKSLRVGSAVDVAVGFNWEPQAARYRGDRGPRVLVHGHHPGLEIHVGSESDWEMRQGAKVLAKSEGSTPTQRAAALLAKLSEFHQV